MNNGVHDGLQHSFGPAIESELYIGYWGDLRPILGVEDPGARSMVCPELPGGAVNINIAVPPFGLVNVALGVLDEQPWMPVCSELPFNAEAFDIYQTGQANASGQSACFAYDIGVGQPGKEQIVLNKFVAGPRHWPQNGTHFADSMGPFPIAIPAGSRVVYRIVQIGNNITNTQFTKSAATLHFYRNYWHRSGNKGQYIPESLVSPFISTPGATNTKGSWETVGFLPFDVTWIVPAPAIVQDNALSATAWVIDYGYINSSGSVVPFIENINGTGDTVEAMWCLSRPYPVDLPRNTEIVARGAFDDLGNATNMVPGFVAIGNENVDTGRRPIGATSLVN